MACGEELRPVAWSLATAAWEYEWDGRQFLATPHLLPESVAPPKDSGYPVCVECDEIHDVPLDKSGGYVDYRTA